MDKLMRKDVLIVFLFAVLLLSFSSRHEAKQAQIEDTTGE
jgi:hypothetical protein